MEDTEFEIGDVESYGNQKDQGFSHQVLVMTAFRKALDNGSKEMKAGWIQDKIDRQGNHVRTHVDDTRKAFIESVESCLDVMECDMDEDAVKEIGGLIKGLEELKRTLIESEDKEWNGLNIQIQRKLTEAGKGNIKGFLDKDKRFYQIYLEESVKVYRKVLRALSKLTWRKDFYKEEVFEA